MTTPPIKKSRSAKGGYALWSYRCFHIKPNKGTWICVNTLRGITLDFPDRFVWNDYDDRIGLKKYIDCVVTGQATEAARWEKAGIVSDIVPNEKHEEQGVHISIERLLEVLSMRDTLRVPLYGRVGLCTSRVSNNKFIPKDFYTIMAKYDVILPGVASDWDEGKAVAVNNKTIGELGIDETHLHSGANLEKGQSVSRQQDPTGEVAPAEQAIEDVKQPKEIEKLRRQVKENVIELFTEVHPDGAQPFFVRRLISSDGKLLFSASAFKVEGPWKEFTRDSSALLALGIEC